ncbi:MAG: hypothetical protein HXX09_08350 [Bacteroidetes bacterium]|nr:hypothetical protein [Bacteroidota bacterium]
MGLSTEMKNLSEEILSSFKNRIKENEELVNDVQKTLDRFQKDHLEMANVLRTNASDLRAKLSKDDKNRLKEADALLRKMSKEHKDMAVSLRTSLDKDEKLRMKEFDSLMKNTNDKISEIYSFTNDMLSESEADRLKKFASLMKSINEDCDGIFKYTHDMLSHNEVERIKGFTFLMKNINKEILRIFTNMHAMLTENEVKRDKDNVLRLQEFDVFMTGIQKEVKNLKKVVAELMGDFADDRKGASAAWKKMSDILAQLRETGYTAPKPIAKIAEKKAIKIEVPAEKETTPIPKETKAVEKQILPLTLEEKVISYINKHPKGVKILEMEQPLGETRMKLGYIAKALLEQGKVQKIENVYFPKNSN